MERELRYDIASGQYVNDVITLVNDIKHVNDIILIEAAWIASLGYHDASNTKF